MSHVAQCRSLAGGEQLDMFAWQIGGQSTPAGMAPTEQYTFGAVIERVSTHPARLVPELTPREWARLRQNSVAKAGA